MHFERITSIMLRFSCPVDRSSSFDKNIGFRPSVEPSVFLLISFSILYLSKKKDRPTSGPLQTTLFRNCDVIANRSGLNERQHTPDLGMTWKQSILGSSDVYMTLELLRSCGIDFTTWMQIPMRSVALVHLQKHGTGSHSVERSVAL
jgi:hypothetical protein